MTLDEFLWRLGQTPRNWALRHNGSIRTKDGWHTPISAVCVMLGEPDARSLSLQDGLRIGLSKNDTEQIEYASDFAYFALREPAYIALRKKLLTACGIQENV